MSDDSLNYKGEWMWKNDSCVKYKFYHTFESGKQVGYEIILKQEEKNIMVDTVCIVQPLLEEKDEQEFYIYREWMNQEIVDLCYHHFGPPDNT